MARTTLTNPSHDNILKIKYWVRKFDASVCAWNEYSMRHSSSVGMGFLVNNLHVLDPSIPRQQQQLRESILTSMLNQVYGHKNLVSTHRITTGGWCNALATLSSVHNSRWHNIVPVLEHFNGRKDFYLWIHLRMDMKRILHAHTHTHMFGNWALQLKSESEYYTFWITTFCFLHLTVLHMNDY